MASVPQLETALAGDFSKLAWGATLYDIAACQLLGAQYGDGVSRKACALLQQVLVVVCLTEPRYRLVGPWYARFVSSSMGTVG